MKKMNLLRTTLAAMFMFCFMAVAFMCTNIDVNAASPTFTVSGKQVRLLDEKGQPVTNKVIYVLSNLSNSSGYTMTAGYYYFNASGYMADLEGNPMVKPVCNLTSTSISSATNLYVGKWTLTTNAISGTTVKPNCILYNGYVGAAFYCKGVKYTGFLLDKTSKWLYYMNNGMATTYSGVATGTYYSSSTSSIQAIPSGGFYAVNGALSSGVANNTYYRNGKLYGYGGWLNYNGNIYYFRSGKALTGWQVLPSYGGGSSSYKYLFNDQGVLYTDLIDYIGYDNFIQKDIMIISNKKTHNTTFYYKDTDGTYVPAKTVVCATARKKGDTPTGTFRLEKTWNKRWYIYKKTGGSPWRYYQWAVKIKGTPSLYHSSTYRKAKANSLRADLYNKIGTSCTTHCIRHQAKYAKMIYDIATKTNKKRRVPVKILNSSTQGPFGHVSLVKISKKTKIDPTDPSYY